MDCRFLPTIRNLLHFRMEKEKAKKGKYLDVTDKVEVRASSSNGSNPAAHVLTR